MAQAIFPTKGNLINTKKSLNLAAMGFNLMDRKRNILIREMVSLIDEAKALLQSTNLSVKEIAFRVGYHSEVNFITAFTDKTGSTPTQFRKNTL